jgi:Phosphotransferase enzyme family
VLKEVRLDGDVILRLLGGRTIEADLWRTGTFERVPYVLDHGIVDAYLDGTTTMLAMRDVSEYLLGGRRMTRAESRFALGAAAQLHRAFAGEEVSAACPVITRISFLSPQSIATERDGVDYLPKMLAVGWEVFWDSVPGEIAEAIQRVHSRPEELASELGKQTLTLCHGDLRWANLGFADERLIALDWGAASAAPAACDFAWYLFVNGARVDATREQLIADFREAEGELFDERAFELALIAQLAWHGALIAHELIEPSDEGRMRAREELDWWCARVGAALERM